MVKEKAFYLPKVLHQGLFWGLFNLRDEKQHPARVRRWLLAAEQSRAQPLAALLLSFPTAEAGPSGLGSPGCSDTAGPDPARMHCFPCRNKPCLLPLQQHPTQWDGMRAKPHPPAAARIHTTGFAPLERVNPCVLDTGCPQRCRGLEG